MKLIEVSNLSIRFGAKTVLEGISLEFHSSELLGLIGPNGAGKTTLLRAICGLARAQQGSILFLGKNLADLSRREIARNLAYLPQKTQAHWRLTVEDLVLLGRLPHRRLWKGPSDEDRKIAKDACAACDVLQLGGRTIDTLSGGEFRRVMLARALAVEPKLLLADEPVTGLDPLHQLQVMEKFRALADLGIGVAIVLHDLSLAARYCDRLILIHGQRIVAAGEPRSVLAQRHLKECFGLEFKTDFLSAVPIVLPFNESRA